MIESSMLFQSCHSFFLTMGSNGLTLSVEEKQFQFISDKWREVFNMETNVPATDRSGAKELLLSKFYSPVALLCAEFSPQFELRPKIPGNFKL